MVSGNLYSQQGRDVRASWQRIYFNCAEQFMMYCKAGRFHDSETQNLVLATRDPKEQKRLARLTKGFQSAGWDEIKSNVVVAGNMAKFGQNKELKDLLLGTGNRLLAEAASLDRVWGIGFTAKEAEAMANRERWGENRLGMALVEVRKRLREETC
ncbi:N-glycosidase [Lachnellula occidentalis]|uniref:N-glycosidase n=1 Tax=Lachnellula occidentalis TaxID=215460 RepID=A0A8H8S112_9HELO|nr:N-glycosidase [Lachnellula occidentalis]